MIKKTLITAVLLVALFNGGQAFEIDRLAQQASLWYALDKPEFLKNPDYSNIPITLSDSSHTYDVLHYQLYLNIPMQNGYFEGAMTMTFEIVEDSIDEVGLNMVHLTAESVVLDGHAATFTATDSMIIIDLDDFHHPYDTLIMTIYYHDNTTNRGYYYYPRNGYTVAEPQDARWWFPCFDEPWDKATSEMYVTVPDTYYVCSNGFLESVYHNPYDHTRTFHWENEDPIATYLISFIIMADYALWEDYYVTPGGDTIPILNMVFAEDSAMAAYDFDHVPEMMQIFSDLFYPYPFNKYGQGAVTPFPYGAMENQTLTVMNRNWIQGNQAELGFAHELAHMWWGDLVTLADWRHMWLNEGFATYSSGIFAEQFIGHDRFIEELLIWRDIYIDHGNTYGHAPIYDPAYLFSVRVYFKGAWVLHMLRGLIGDTDFYNGLHNYASQFAYGNADTWDFINVMETTSGEELDWFFDQWVFGQAHPIYHYSWNYAGNGPYNVNLNVHQVQTAAPPFRMPITIRIYSGTNEYNFEVENQFEYHSYDFTVPAEPDSLALDPDHWILKEVSELTSIDDGDQPILPSSVELLSPYPNPFNGSVNISFSVEGSPRKLSVDIFDILGRKVKALATDNYQPGYYILTWDGRGDNNKNLGSGAYFVLLRSADISQTRKILYIR